MNGNGIHLCNKISFQSNGCQRVVRLMPVQNKYTKTAFYFTRLQKISCSVALPANFAQAWQVCLFYS